MVRLRLRSTLAPGFGMTFQDSPFDESWRQPTCFNGSSPKVKNFMKKLLPSLTLWTLLLALIALVPGLSFAQTTSGSISGVVADPTGARIPGATVVLTNTASRSKRTVSSNAEGLFAFQAVPATRYSITISRAGFETLVTRDIEVHPNDQLNLSELRLSIGAETVSVTVEAQTDISTSGERSSLITDRDIAKLSTVGREVSELLRTQAGFAVNQSGLDNSTTSSAEVAGGFSGLNNYVGNGATGNGASMISDGANVTDPGSGNQQTQTVNMDFVQEVKIETSNFGADTAKGPTVITAVGKSGGQSFHGNVHLFVRDHVLNDQDWFAKYQGLPQIPDRYMYPGISFGGPVLIPHTNFNHDRKLTFEAGDEDYIQTGSYAYGSPLKSFLQALVPTQAMRNGDFSTNSIATYLGVSPATVATQCSATGTLSTYLHTCGSPQSVTAGYNTANMSNYTAVGGMLSGIDPHAAAILNAYYPLPNGPTVSGFNYHTLNLENPTSNQFRVRLDYAKNESNKLYAVYSGQFGHTNQIPENIYYSPGTSNSAIIGGVDTPGKINSISRSNLGSINYTHLFNSQATNELFAGLSSSNQYFTPGNGSLLQQNTYGYSSVGIFPGATKALPAIATYSTSGSAILPFAITPDFSQGQYVAKKFLPSGGDNFSYLYKSHTFKVGFYAERDTSNQTDLSPATNGTSSSYYVNGVTTTLNGAPENYLADFFVGAQGSFTQQNFNAQSNLFYWTISGYLNDSWKVNKKLTIDYGVRFDHLGPWNDKHGIGLPIFSNALYNSDPHTVSTANKDNTTLFLPGIRWHGGNGANSLNAGDANLPNSGSPGRWAFVSPRFGFAYDALGNGTTIFRGGWGQFRGHDSWNDYVGPAATAQGLVTATAGGNGYISFNQLTPSSFSATRCDASGSNGCPSILALDPTDSEQPLTETYSVSVSQRMPGNAVFDMAYVGNQSTHLLTDNVSNTAVNSFDLRDINAVHIGALFQPDPNPNSATYGQILNPTALSTNQVNDFRQYNYYQHIGVPRHIAYANYNALQATYNKQRGRLNYGLNYTWSKAQGVRGAFSNGLSGDPTNLRANYGPLAFDRTHIANLSYSYDVGQSYHFAHRILNGLSNGWLISGITNLQSGPNLQAVVAPNLSLTGNTTTSYNGAACASSPCVINSNQILGTPDVMLQPVLRPSALCPSGNPTSGLASKQFINGNCFGLPSQGVNGPTNLGYIRGPAFFDTDLTVQKTIPFKDQRSLQLRAAGFNFINHPLTTFSSRYPAEAALQLNGTSFQNVGLTNGANTHGGGCSAAGSTCFGYAGYKTGRRVVELEARYTF